MGRKLPVMSYIDEDTGVLYHQTIIPKQEDRARPHWTNISGSKQPEILVEIMKDEEGEHIGFLPTRENATDAGLDLFAAEDVCIAPLTNALKAQTHRVLVSTGIKVEIPPGLCWLLWDRSGMSAKHGIHRMAGVIDDIYRGEIKIALINLSHTAYHIKRGDRIAQAILTPMILGPVRQVESLSETSRGKDGFGSTGR